MFNNFRAIFFNVILFLSHICYGRWKIFNSVFLVLPEFQVVYFSSHKCHRILSGSVLSVECVIIFMLYIFSLRLFSSKLNFPTSSGWPMRRWGGLTGDALLHDMPTFGCRSGLYVYIWNSPMPRLFSAGHGLGYALTLSWPSFSVFDAIAWLTLLIHISFRSFSLFANNFVPWCCALTNYFLAHYLHSWWT